MQKKLPTLGCCGLDCGLCPRYYTVGSSKCPGCCGEDFFNKHPSCSFVTCCVKNKNFEVCAECTDFPCRRFDKETGETDSFITHRMVLPNQYFIKKFGVAEFIDRQKIRIGLLETMLEHFDDGNCKSFFCLAAALLSIEGIKQVLIKAEQELQEQTSRKDDRKGKAKILKELLTQLACEEKVELKLRKAIKR